MAKTRKQKNKKTKKQIFGTYIYKCGCRWEKGWNWVKTAK